MTLKVSEEAQTPLVLKNSTHGEIKGVLGSRRSMIGTFGIYARPMMDGILPS